MITLPVTIMAVLEVFAPVFSERIWDWVQILVVGAILTPGKRTVTSCLRAVGLQKDKQFQNYHRVLNRVGWSSLEVSQRLFALLMKIVVKDQVLVLGADETLERRRGVKIPHLGCFRDAARSSKNNKVKSYGLRWVSMMILSQMPWSQRIWALPFLTVLAPGVNSDEQAERRHKTSIDWIRQMICQVRQWLPDHPTVMVVDGALISLELGLRCQQFDHPVALVSRLQHNARLFELPPANRPKQRGQKPTVGKRYPLLKQLIADPDTAWQDIEVTGYGGKLKTIKVVSQVALWYTYGKPRLKGRAVWVYDPSGQWESSVLFATDPTLTAQEVIEFFVMRWNVEVTFEEVRAHLGFETQRQWSPLAILRSSPALLGLYSLVMLLAQHLLQGDPPPVRTSAWYCKTHVTFSDVLAFVRQQLWHHTQFPRTRSEPYSGDITDALLFIWEDILCYAS